MQEPVESRGLASNVKDDSTGRWPDQADFRLLSEAPAVACERIHADGQVCGVDLDRLHEWLNEHGMPDVTIRSADDA